MNWKLLLMMVGPILSQIAFLIAAKDADDEGIDDKAAKFLKYAAVAIQAIIADQPLPVMSADLAKVIK